MAKKKLKRRSAWKVKGNRTVKTAKAARKKGR